MEYQQREALKQKITLGGICVVAGGVAWWIVLAGVLGWVSPTTAHQRTSNAVQAKVDQVLAPFCATQFLSNKAALAKFMKASAGYDRTEVVQNTITKIGTTAVDYQLSDNCASAVEARLKSASRKPAPTSSKKS